MVADEKFASESLKYFLAFFIVENSRFYAI